MTGLTTRPPLVRSHRLKITVKEDLYSDGEGEQGWESWTSYEGHEISGESSLTYGAIATAPYVRDQG